MAEAPETPVEDGPTPPEPSPPPFGGPFRRRLSFAQCDIFKYRKAFDTFDRLKEGYILATDLQDCALRMGYKIPDAQIDVRKVDCTK